MKTKKTEKKSLNKIVVINVVIIALVSVIGVLFIYKPFASKNRAIRENILIERDKNLLIGKIKALDKYLKVYDKRIPEGVGVSWLLGEISNMASKEQVEVSSIKPDNPEDYGLYTKLFVVVDVATTYSQLGRFIAGIESSGKFLKVESANIKRMDLSDNFEKGSDKFKAFDVKADIVISTIVPKE